MGFDTTDGWCTFYKKNRNHVLLIYVNFILWNFNKFYELIRISHYQVSNTNYIDLQDVISAFNLTDNTEPTKNFPFLSYTGAKLETSTDFIIFISIVSVSKKLLLSSRCQSFLIAQFAHPYWKLIFTYCVNWLNSKTWDGICWNGTIRNTSTIVYQQYLISATWFRNFAHLLLDERLGDLQTDQ